MMVGFGEVDLRVCSPEPTNSGSWLEDLVQGSEDRVA